MTRAWESLLALLLTGALCYLVWGAWRLGAFYVRRWRVQREVRRVDRKITDIAGTYFRQHSHATARVIDRNTIAIGFEPDDTFDQRELDRLALEGIARMERKP